MTSQYIDGERIAHLEKMLDIAQARIRVLEAEKAQAQADAAVEVWSGGKVGRATPDGLRWLAEHSGAASTREAILEGAEASGLGLFPAEPE